MKKKQYMNGKMKTVPEKVKSKHCRDKKSKWKGIMQE